MSDLTVGSVARLAATFKDANGDAADPDTVTFKTKDPSDTIVSYIFGVGGSGVVKDATGEYHKDIPITEGGIWVIRIEGVGTIDAARERTMSVAESAFS